MATAATLIMWFKLRSPELAEEFESLMVSDRDIVRAPRNTPLPLDEGVRRRAATNG
jgi:hypothetical protein